MNDKYIFPDDVRKEQHVLISDLEMRVLKLIASGKSASEIANALSLSNTTVNTYRGRLLEKMNVKNNAELTLYALINHIV